MKRMERVALLFGCVLAVFSTVQEAYAIDPEYNSQVIIEMDKKISAMNIQLLSLKGITEDIEGLSDQLNLLDKKISQVSENVNRNEDRATELESGLRLSSKGMSSKLAGIKIKLKSLSEEGISLKTDLSKTKLSLDDNIKTASSNQIELKKLINTPSELLRINSAIERRASSVDMKISDVNNDISSRTLYLVAGLIILIMVIVWLKRRFTNDNAALSGQITNAREALDGEYNSLDLKLTEILGKQISVDAMNDAATEENAINHSLPLKVSIEIHRMRKRIASMANDTKGIKPLAKALERLEENLVEQDYEIVDLLGQKYVDGMSVNQEFVLDEDLSPSERNITKVITPQVNYKGEIIQVADVVVSTGE